MSIRTNCFKGGETVKEKGRIIEAVLGGDYETLFWRGRRRDSPGTTARKLGMTPRMRFGCGLSGCSSELAADVEGDGKSGVACAGCWLNSEWRTAEAQEAWGDFAVPHRRAKPLVARLGRVPVRAR